MVSDEFKTRTIKALIFSGLLVAVLSVLEPRIEWLSNLCGFLGNGCKDTEQFLLFGIPLSVWGVIFYTALLISFLTVRSMTFWLVLCGAGVELFLVKIMFLQQLICFLCVLNFLILLLLVIVITTREDIWKAFSVSLLLFITVDASLLNSSLFSGITPSPEQNSPVIAVVGGTHILKTDIEKPIAGQLNKLEKKIFKLKRNELDNYIEKTLLKMDAEEKNVSAKNLIRKLLSTVKMVNQTEIDAHYREHKDYYDRQNNSKEDTRKKIRTYLQEKRLAGKIKDYVRPLKEKYGVSDYLIPPPMPIADINISNSFSAGPANAPVTIIEFSDYLCPSCQRAHKITSEIKNLYRGKVKWVFKDYPLKRHKGAKKLAEAARCAGEQGKFWEYQDLLFASKEKPDAETLIQYARNLGLNINRFTQSLNRSKYRLNVERDISDALKSGISSTPTFIINGKLHSGAPTLDEFKSMIEKELNH